MAGMGGTCVDKSHVLVGGNSDYISHKLFLKSLYKSPFPFKYVNLCFV